MSGFDVIGPTSRPSIPISVAVRRRSRRGAAAPTTLGSDAADHLVFVVQAGVRRGCRGSRWRRRRGSVRRRRAARCVSAQAAPAHRARFESTTARPRRRRLPHPRCSAQPQRLSDLGVGGGAHPSARAGCAMTRRRARPPPMGTSPWSPAAIAWAGSRASDRSQSGSASLTWMDLRFSVDLGCGGPVWSP